MSRRNPLVCQYIEGLSSEALETYAPIIRDFVGRRHGVYALYRREKLYYVGLATNLRRRLNAHLRNRNRGHWDRFSVYLTIDHRYLKELESLAIRIAQPRGNKQRGKFARSENLTRTLRHRWREQKKNEWLALIGRKPQTVNSNDQSTRTRRGHHKRPTLARYVSHAMSLRAQFKKKAYKARVRKNGTIRVAKRVFNSPSKAAAFVLGRKINGWWFWMYERAPGQWVRLRELRRR